MFFIYAAARSPKGITAQRQTPALAGRARLFDLPSVLVISGSRGAAAKAIRLDYHVDDSPQNCTTRSVGRRVVIGARTPSRVPDSRLAIARVRRSLNGQATRHRRRPTSATRRSRSYIPSRPTLAQTHAPSCCSGFALDGWAGSRRVARHGSTFGWFRPTTSQLRVNPDQKRPDPSGPTFLSSRPNRSTSSRDAEADDARRDDRLDVVGVRSRSGVPRIAWIVLALARLKMSSDGTNRTLPNVTGRSTWKSRFWKFGSRLSPTGSSRTSTCRAPFGRRRRLDRELAERIALTRVVERRHVDAERQLIHAAQLEQPLGVDVDVADAAAGGQVVVLVARRASSRLVGSSDDRRGACVGWLPGKSPKFTMRAVVGEAACSSSSGCAIRLRPVSSKPLKVRLKSGDVRQRDHGRQLEGRLVVGDRRAGRRADALPSAPGRRSPAA